MLTSAFFAIAIVLIDQAVKFWILARQCLHEFIRPDFCATDKNCRKERRAVFSV